MGWFDWVGSKPKKRPEDQRANEIMPAIDDLYQDHREQHHAGQDEAAQHYGDPPRSRREADEHAVHHPHPPHHADGFNAEGWRGIRDGVRGNGAPAAHERGKQNGHAQDGDLDDRTHQTGQVSLKDQIFGAIGDRIPAPGVAPDGGHKRRR